MKAAISLPDNLFSQAEKTAKKLGIPRSQLFARAVEEFIANHNSADVTERINEVLKHNRVGLDPQLAAMQTWTLLRNSPDESW